MAEEDQLLRYAREDFYREIIPNVDGTGNMQYYFDAYRDTDQSSSLQSLGVPERPASPSCIEQVALENYLPGGFFTSNSLDQFGDVRIAVLEPPAAEIECSNSTKLDAAAGAPKLLAGDHHYHNSGSFLSGSRGSLNSQRVFFEDHLHDHIEGGQPANLNIHPSRINSVASTSDCKSTSNTVDVTVEAAGRECKPRTWRGCSPNTLMVQLRGAPASSAALPSASKFSNFDHRPNNMELNFDHQPINIITSAGKNTQSATQHQQQVNYVPSMNAPSRPNPLYTQPCVSINPLNHSYSNAERDSAFRPQSVCTKGAGDHNHINTSMTMSWATHLPDHHQQTGLRGPTESCHHPGLRGVGTSSECEVNAVDQSFTANSHVTPAGSGWPDGRTGACSQIKLAWVDNSSGNNSWSSCTSPGPSSNDQNEEVVGPIDITSWADPMFDMKLPSHLDNFPAYNVVSELERTPKKVKGTMSTHHVACGWGISTSEDGLILSTVNNLGDQHYQQKRKRPRSLKEKILHLILQTDPHSSKECQIQALDNTMEFLKNLRTRLKDSTCSSLQELRQGGMGFLADATEIKSCNESAVTADASVSLRSSKVAGVGGSSAHLQLEKLEFETEGPVDYTFSVDNVRVPELEVRMMDEHEVMVKLTARDRPGLFCDIVVVLKNMGLDIQHCNLRTNKGERQDVFAAKMKLPNCSIHTQTNRIADALFKVIRSTT